MIGERKDGKHAKTDVSEEQKKKKNIKKPGGRRDLVLQTKLLGGWG